MKSLTTPKTFEARPITAFIFHLLFSWKTWITLFILSWVCMITFGVWYFNKHYVIINPIQSRSIESYVDVVNERAACLQSKPQVTTYDDMAPNNKKALEEWNVPVNN